MTPPPVLSVREVSPGGQDMTPSPTILRTGVRRRLPPPIRGISKEAYLTDTDTIGAGTINTMVMGGPEKSKKKGGHTPKPRGVVKKKKECVHDEGGSCNIHGEGAVRKWKPTNVLTKGADGKMTMEYKRVPYYECDAVMRGRGRLRQPKLSNVRKTTLTQTPNFKENVLFDASKVGQSTTVRGDQTDGQRRL